MASKLISVVIPAYNAEPFLDETIDSVLNQTYENIEVIVVNDGSKDHTPDLAQAWCDRDNRVRLISVPNGGVAAARNRGIEEAKGDYVAPLDSDDLWHPEKLARQAKILASDRGISFVYAHTRYIDAESRVFMTAVRAQLEGRAYLRHIAHNAVGHGSGLLFRREDALRVGCYDQRLHKVYPQGAEDYLFQLRLAQIGEMRVAPGYLVGYRKTEGALSTDSYRMLRSRLGALEIVAAENDESAQVIRETQSVMNFLMVITCLRTGRFEKVLPEIAKTWKLSSFGSIGEYLSFLKYRATQWRARRSKAGHIPNFGILHEDMRHFRDYCADEESIDGLLPYIENKMVKLEPLDRDYAISFDKRQAHTTTETVQAAS